MDASYSAGSQQLILLRLVDYCMQVGLRFGEGSFALMPCTYICMTVTAHVNYLFVIGLAAASLAQLMLQ